MKNKILIIIPFFYPGYKIGGPQRTIENVVDCFGDKADFYIYTINHDMGETEPYDGIETGKWLPYKNAQIMYLPDKEYYGKTFEEMYLKFDIIYSCSLFANNSIKLLCIHRRKKCFDKKVYIAPMGVLEEGAYSSKNFKKRAFITIFKQLGMFKNIIWSFTSEKEKDTAIKILGKDNTEKYIVAEDLPAKVDFEYYNNKVQSTNKSDDTLKVCFISRICPQKNLDYAIDVLNNDYPKKIVFDIYGVIEDKDYWEICKEKLKYLPNNVVAQFKGLVKPDEVLKAFSEHDIFLFPTKGENFGHVIYEALAAGCVPVISDRTPWKELEANGCGTVIDLARQELFVKQINSYANMSKTTFESYQKSAINYAKSKLEMAVADSGYCQIF